SEYHQPAHRRCADFGEMGLWPVCADWLPLALANPEHVDELGPDDQPDRERRQQRRTGAEGLVADEIEQPFEFKPLRKQIEHLRRSAFPGGEMGDDPAQPDRIRTLHKHRVATGEAEFLQRGYRFARALAMRVGDTVA